MLGVLPNTVKIPVNGHPTDNWRTLTCLKEAK